MGRPPPKWVSGLKDAIENDMHQGGGDLGATFITRKQLETLWTCPLGAAQSPFSRIGLQGDRAQDMAKNCLTILSILAVIDWPDWSPSRLIDMLFLEPLCPRTDWGLPFASESEELQAMFGADSLSRRRFRREQLPFVPIILEEGKYGKYTMCRPLPFLSEHKVLASGFSGEVTKVQVAEGQYNGAYAHKNYVQSKHKMTPLFLARKKILRADSFRKEVKNLTTLHRSRLKNEHILLHLATVEVQNEFNIFFPWMDRTLDTFIHDPHSDQLIRDPSAIRDMILQLSYLAEALNFLHTQISNEHGPCPLFHMDLKPDNILIDENSGGGRVGKWMISDFGLSQEVQGRVWREELETLRDAVDAISAANRRTSDVSVERKELKAPPKPGAFQAPEVESGNLETTTAAYADIWSFGCITATVLAFIDSGAEGVEILECTRAESVDGIEEEHDFFYETIARQYRVKQRIQRWLACLYFKTESPHHNILQNSAELVLDMLEIDPLSRRCARDICTHLQGFVQEGPEEYVRYGRSHFCRQFDAGPLYQIQRVNDLAGKENELVGTTSYSISIPHVQIGNITRERSQYTRQEALRSRWGTAETGLGKSAREARSAESLGDGEITTSRKELIHRNVVDISICFSSYRLLVLESRHAIVYRHDASDDWPYYVLECPAGWVWTHGRLCGSYCGLRRRIANSKGKETVCQLWSVERGWHLVHQPDKSFMKGVLDFEVSATGWILLRRCNEIEVFERTKHMCRLRTSQTVHQDIRFEHVAIDSESTCLCTLGFQKWQIWDISGEQLGPPSFQGEIRLAESKARSSQPFLMPFPRSPAFLVFDTHHETVAVLQKASSGTQKVSPMRPFGSDTKILAVAISAGEDLLILLTQKRKAQGFSLRKEIQCSLCSMNIIQDHEGRWSLSLHSQRTISPLSLHYKPEALYRIACGLDASSRDMISVLSSLGEVETLSI